MTTAVKAAPAGHGSVRQAAALTATLIVLGTGLGFARDLLMAYLFGASDGTDAFLVAWTVPETASPLLIEDAMALLMVPVISRALQEHGGARGVLRKSLPLVAGSLTAVAALLWLAAPVLVGVLAPNIASPELAARFTALTATTVITFGVAGLMSATLRAHHRFGPPAVIYACYNAGILAAIVLAQDALGVASAALGVAVGGLLMVLVQTPGFLRCIRRPSPPADLGVLMGIAATAAPIALYTLTRQAQVFVERYFGSGLAPGSITHLNYAQKVSQVPMVVSLMLITVTFPWLARAYAAGDRDQVGMRLRTDLVLAGGIALTGTAVLCVFAPQIVTLLFQHGQFTAADTAATAGVIRMYALGLVGQTVVGVLVRAYFAAARPSWYPVAAMGAGLATTAAVAAACTPLGGVAALGLANAAGICVTAAVLFVNAPAIVPLPVAETAGLLARLAAAAVLAAAAGAATGETLSGRLPAPLVLCAGALVIAAVMCLWAAAMGLGRALRPPYPYSRTSRARRAGRARRSRRARSRR